MLKSKLPVPENVAGFRDKIFREATKIKWSHMGGVLSNVMGVLIRRDQYTDTQTEDHEKIQIEDSHLQTKEKGLRRNQLC